MSAATITLAQQKGGTGKTTLALHLAQACIMQGFKVGVIDVTQSGTTHRWLERYSQIHPLHHIDHIASADWRFHKDVETFKSHNDIVLIDSDAFYGNEIRTPLIFQASDLLLIPMQPSAFDEQGAHETIALAKDLRVPHRIILNRCDKNEASQISESLKPLLLNQVISDHTAYRDSLRFMSPLWTTDADPEVTQEINTLTQELLALLLPADAQSAANHIDQRATSAAL